MPLTRSAGSLPFAMLVLLAAAGAAAAQDPTGPANAPPLGAPAPDTAAGEAWQRFLAAHPEGTWWSRWCAATGTPREIWGSGLPPTEGRADSLLEARRHAERLLAGQRELLGLGASEFREAIGARMGQTWVLVYDQHFRGIPVIGGRADVRVHESGRIPMFGSMAWPIPADFDPTPRLDDASAQRIAWLQAGPLQDAARQPGREVAPRLVIWGDLQARERATPRLAWEVQVRNVDADGNGLLGRCYVDARTGVVLHVHDDRHSCCGAHGPAPTRSQPETEPRLLTPSPTPSQWTATGQLLAPARTGPSGLAPTSLAPVSGALVQGGGASTYTDSAGNFALTWTGAASTVAATFVLAGIHNQLVQGPNAPSLTQTLTAGANGTIQLAAPGDLEAAHTTTHYWIYRVNEFCRSVLGNTPQLAAADAVQPIVNIAQACNAYYYANTINFYQAGNGCVNTAFSSVVAHEWGHGLDERYGGITNNNSDGLSEGWGDIVSMYLLDNPIVGDGFFANGGAIRNGNNGTLFPPPSEVHAAGEVWMGFAWQLREHFAQQFGGRPSAIALTNRIVLGSIVANALDQQAALLQVYLADDDDGNLANLTPHATAIKWAADLKRYPYPLAPPLQFDECRGALTVGIGVSPVFDNGIALDSDPAASCSSGMTKDLWFRVLADRGPLSVSTCGLAAFDTVLEVYSGACGALTSLGCNDNACGGVQSSVTVTVAIPGWQLIRVGGKNLANGPFQLAISGTPGTLASAVPYGQGCGPVGAPALALSGAAPRLGTTGFLTTRNYPAGASLGVLVQSLTVVDPGQDLAPLGMTGCRGYVGQSGANLLQTPTAGQSFAVLTAPNVPDFMGIRIAAQSFAFVPGANPAGAIASNGLLLTVGF